MRVILNGEIEINGQIQIVCNGTRWGTRVLVNDKFLRDVPSVEFSLTPNGTEIAIRVVTNLPVGTLIAAPDEEEAHEAQSPEKAH